MKMDERIRIFVLFSIRVNEQERKNTADKGTEDEDV